jgi:2-pyrone-4,6-dicarboxylate lactonase
VTPLAHAFVRHAPNAWSGEAIGRTSIDGREMPNDGDLLDLLLEWVPDEATRNRILVDNACALYGFRLL